MPQRGRAAPRPRPARANPEPPRWFECMRRSGPRAPSTRRQRSHTFGPPARRSRLPYFRSGQADASACAQSEMAAGSRAPRLHRARRSLAHCRRGKAQANSNAFSSSEAREAVNAKSHPRNKDGFLLAGKTIEVPTPWLRGPRSRRRSACRGGGCWRWLP